MAKFKTDYKDEIVDKRTRQILDAGTGAVIHNNVLVKNTYTPKQSGDKVGATWFNDAGKRFNDIEDGATLVNTAKYANSLAGYSTVKLFKASGYAYSISADHSLAFLNWQVGAQFAGCMAIATPQCISGTPYRDIYCVATGMVSDDGYLQIEITGTGFIAAHIFALSVLVFKQI